MTLEERLNIANKLRMQGYNCAQCVAMAFEDVHGVDSTTMARLSIGFGGGVGGQGEICGVVSAMALVEGFCGDGTPHDKRVVYPSVAELSKSFCSLNGSVVCRELKQMNPPRPCNALILCGVELLHKRLEEGR